MKKVYESPEWEVVDFSENDIFMLASCPDDCTHCFYLVCQPEDVIIGG